MLDDKCRGSDCQQLYSNTLCTPVSAVVEHLSPPLLLLLLLLLLLFAGFNFGYNCGMMTFGGLVSLAPRHR
jgi:hypothetical protein